jgi:hypothetical protein
MASLALAVAALVTIWMPAASAGTAGLNPAAPHSATTSLCKSNSPTEAFNFLIWSNPPAKYQCIRAYTTIKPTGTLSRLIIASGDEVWMHQRRNGTGWADCFRAGSAWDLLGRDMHPGTVVFTRMPGACLNHPAPINVSLPTCGSPLVSLFAWASSSKGVQCWEFPSGTIIIHETLYYFLNATQRQVIFYQKVHGRGWSDCFSPSSPYDVMNSRDAHPGKIVETGVTGYCR